MKKITSAFVFGLIGVLLNVHLAGAGSPSDLFLNIEKADLWIRVVVTDTCNSSYDTERGHSEQHDRINVTVEGTYKFKKYEIPDIPDWPDIPGLPPLPSYPRAAMLIEDSKTLSISGNGGGYSYNRFLSEDCKPPYYYPCRDFRQDGTYNWHYSTVNPVYDEGVVTDLEIYQESENDPVRYKFQISGPFNGDLSTYISGSGTSTRTYRGYTLNTTDTLMLDEYYGPSSNGTPWDNWIGTPDGGEVAGVLTFEGDQFTASGQIVYPYRYTSDDGIEEIGKVEISYKFNPKPGAKKIQPNQALGRYKYVDDEHYVPASDFVAGKETAIQVFFDKAVPVGELSGKISLKVSKDGSSVATLTDFTRDTENNAIIFRPKDRSECGNWEAGTYKSLSH